MEACVRQYGDIEGNLKPPERCWGFPQIILPSVKGTPQAESPSGGGKAGTPRRNVKSRGLFKEKQFGWCSCRVRYIIKVQVWQTKLKKTEVKMLRACIPS